MFLLYLLKKYNFELLRAVIIAVLCLNFLFLMYIHYIELKDDQTYQIENVVGLFQFWLLIFIISSLHFFIEGIVVFIMYAMVVIISTCHSEISKSYTEYKLNSSQLKQPLLPVQQTPEVNKS